MDQNQGKRNVCRRLLLSAGIAAALSAATLHAADTIAYACNSYNGQLGTVDLNTGVFTQLGIGLSTGGFGVSGGALYGITADYVFQVNLSTGALTYAPNYSLSNNLQGFGSTTAGLFVVDGYGDLISVNPSTGAPTLIGSTGVTSGLGAGVLSTSADSTTLYWDNNGGAGPELYRINTSTGEATLVGATGNGAGSGSVEAMLFEGGTLWAALGYNTGPQIGTLNTSTAAETIVSTPSVNGILALAPYPLSALPGPTVSYRGVISAYQFGALASPAPGSWIEIYGSNLATDSRAWATTDFTGASGLTAPTALDGTSVTIGGQPAYVEYISPGQVNVQVPSTAPTGAQPIVVTVGSNVSQPQTIVIGATAPGFWAPSALLTVGNQYVGALFPDFATFVLPPGAVSGLTSQRARPGDTIILYGIGFGPVTTNLPAGQIAQGLGNTLPTSSFEISFDGTPATVKYAGLTPGSVGLYQFNVVVPNVAANDLTRVTFTLGGAAGTQTLYTAIGN